MSQESLEGAYYSAENTDMRNRWYPFVMGTSLAKGAVQGHHILGDPIVLYRDPENGEPIALADKCAHRSAPLSVGRMMDGRLECRYHGWQFDGSGICTKIPSNAKIPGNAKVRKYPMVEAENFLWIWPGDLDRVKDVPSPKIYYPKENPDWVPRVGVEVLDIDASLLCENFLDPAHIPFTHENTIGKRSNATLMSITCEFVDKIALGLGVGISGVVSTPERPDLGVNNDRKFEFYGPCLVSLDFGPMGDQTFYSVPTRKGHCHFIYIQRFSFLQFLEKNFLGKMMMDWQGPAYTKKILMEDYAMLKGQQERLAAGANAMNSPVAADKMIKMYRNWWRKVMRREDGGPWFKGYSEDMEDILLDDLSLGKARIANGSGARSTVISKRNNERGDE
ncbi:hypothetical protein BC830DRAFT_1164842 [Chytriomyces sp. MP71]|nr:hypothetical protein BC830DRAFT_1164842 [Chytriomyces sp. MP71]